MSAKIYVGNLNYKVTEDDLEELFIEYGEVLSINIISDKYTNRSKGFGFIEMGEADAAKAAITTLNEKDWFDRKIIVNEARERSEKPGNNYR